jgi:hypothetical protein
MARKLMDPAMTRMAGQKFHANGVTWIHVAGVGEVMIWPVQRFFKKDCHGMMVIERRASMVIRRGRFSLQTTKAFCDYKKSEVGFSGSGYHFLLPILFSISV